MSIVIRRDSRSGMHQVTPLVAKRETPRAQWPRVFLLTAASIALACALCDAGGFRADVAIVCGMAPASNAHALLGVLYVGSHLALVAIAPILTLAACFGIAVYRRF